MYLVEEEEEEELRKMINPHKAVGGKGLLNLSH